MKFYFVYVLLSSADGKFYIGSTGCIERRYFQHQVGLNTSTKYRRPLSLIFYEAYLRRSDAERREYYFKSTKGKVTIRQLLRDYLQ